MSKPVILVTGKNGQLGSELQQLASSFTEYHFVFTDRTDLDITDDGKLDTYFETEKISFCINAAAYTAVDKAETEKELAMQVNGEAVGKLATACSRYNARFIHISTDYVFDGTATSPYKVDHPVSPVNFYGETKLKGEQLSMQNSADAIIIRTSWVYSIFGNNFVKTMLRLMKDRESINVVNDQVGSPTHAADLASAILHIVGKLACNDSAEGGIYHYSNSGVISWYDFAVAIRDFAGLSSQVNPIPSSAYPTPARRPHYSVMDTSKIAQDFGCSVPEWRSSLEEFFRRLK